MDCHKRLLQPLSDSPLAEASCFWVFAQAEHVSKSFFGVYSIVSKSQNEITERQQRINVAISKMRYKVERTFGSMHRWYGTGIARYVGLSKTHTQHIVQSIVLVGGVTGYIEKELLLSGKPQIA